MFSASFFCFVFWASWSVLQAFLSFSYGKYAVMSTWALYGVLRPIRGYQHNVQRNNRFFVQFVYCNLGKMSV